MKAYMVIYDLQAGDDYNALVDAIESKSNSIKVLESTYLFRSNYSASLLNDEFREHIKPGRNIIVFEFKAVQGERNGWLDKGIWNWLESYVG